MKITTTLIGTLVAVLTIGGFSLADTPAKPAQNEASAAKKKSEAKEPQAPRSDKEKETAGKKATPPAPGTGPSTAEQQINKTKSNVKNN